MKRSNARGLNLAAAKREAQEQLEAKLLEGVNSPERALPAADWSAMRTEAVAMIEVRKQQPAAHDHQAAARDRAGW